jgi:hypothetical protein
MTQSIGETISFFLKVFIRAFYEKDMFIPIFFSIFLYILLLELFLFEKITIFILFVVFIVALLLEKSFIDLFKDRMVGFELDSLLIKFSKIAKQSFIGIIVFFIVFKVSPSTHNLLSYYADRILFQKAALLNGQNYYKVIYYKLCNLRNSYSLQEILDFLEDYTIFLKRRGLRKVRKDLLPWGEYKGTEINYIIKAKIYYFVFSMKTTKCKTKEIKRKLLNVYLNYLIFLAKSNVPEGLFSLEQFNRIISFLKKNEWFNNKSMKIKIETLASLLINKYGLNIRVN